MVADLQNIKSKFDIVVSNPPYIKENDYNKLGIQIRKYEPRIALEGGKDGLKFYKIFAKYIKNNMNKNSIFICEIGYNQLNDCKIIFSKSNLRLLKVSKDIQKIDRTLTFLKI